MGRLLVVNIRSFFKNNSQQKIMKSAILAPRINIYMCDVFFEDDEYVRKCKCEVAEQIFLSRRFPITR